MEDKGESKFRNVMERYWYALFIIAVALTAAVIGFICEAWKMQEGFLYDLLTSIISTTIAFFLFTLTYQLLTKRTSAQSIVEEIKPLLDRQQQRVKEEFRNEVDDSIVKSLGAELDIIQKYDSKEVIDVVNNCSERLLGSLLAKNMQGVFSSILKNPSYRDDMVYDIQIIPNRKDELYDEAGQYMRCKDAGFCISQSLRYKKYLKKGTENKLTKFSCFFAFNENPFFQKEQGEVFFLREELSCLSFIESLNVENAVSLLNYSVEFYLGNVPICVRDIEVELVKLENSATIGIKLTSDIPDRVLCIDGEYVYFDAKIKCSYPTLRREFYFKVPELTRHADVSISLPSSKEELHLVSFTDNYRIESYGHNRYSFRHGENNNEILLPNNGFTAVW